MISREASGRQAPIDGDTMMTWAIREAADTFMSALVRPMAMIRLISHSEKSRWRVKPINRNQLWYAPKGDAEMTPLYEIANQK